ncbi:hypothetical protein JKP88DRAFT_316821 [Tribonema minus]|uniref:Right handed beta helix domain-containing protein n=1 Tax=Tribonema minus TaxID=303371 RepID=A0A836CFN7_9STRA|nr:hypothetical protein JKP88DRAFT_316821 [Tribonema minus]
MGADTVTIDGSLMQTGAMFNVSGGAKLIVEGVTLRGGHSKASGGAIRVDDDESIGGGSGGEVHLVNVAFEDNFSEVSGGALFLGAKSVARVRGGSFINNEAAGLDGDFGGGAIFQTEDSAAYVDGVLFVNNRANKGSGVMVDFHAHSHISNCMFSRHTASAGNDHMPKRNTSPPYYKHSKSFERSMASASGTLIAAASGDVASLLGTFRYYCKVQKISGESSEEGGLTAVNCIFRNNSAIYGGVIWTEPGCKSLVRLKDCLLEDNEARTTGGGAIKAGDVARMELVNCTLSRNRADAGNGGALWISPGSKINITGGTFSDNKSPRGGAIFMEGSDDGKLQLLDVTFADNAADYEGGGVWLARLGLGSATNCTFMRNRAQYGGAIYTRERDTDPFTVANCNFEDNIAENAGAAIMQMGAAWMTNVTNTAFEGNTASCCYIGGYGTVGREIGSSCQDVDTAASINCCPADTYAASNQCVECDPELLDCSVPGTNVSTLPLNPGFWRGSMTAGQEVVLTCWNDAACKGGVAEDPDGYCNAGYEGPYCAVCAPNYTSVVAYKCHECRSGAVIVFVLVLLFILLVLVGILVSFALSGGQRGSTSAEMAVTTREGYEVMGGTQKFLVSLGNIGVRALASLRIPIIVFQVLTQYFNITGVPLPQLYRDFIVWLDFINMDLSVLLSLGCVFPANFYDRLLISTLLPLGVLALLGVAYLVVDRRARIHGRRGRLHSVFVEKAGLMVFTLTFFVFSISSTTIFQTFACDKIAGTEKSYLRADYSLECHTATYRAYRAYAVFMIFVFPVGIPAMYMALLWRQRNAIQAVSEEYDLSARFEVSAPLRATAFLWQPYTRGMYYWEVVECGRRLLLASCVVFILPGSLGQSSYACVFAYFSIVVYLRCSPHVARIDGRLYVLGATILFLSYFVGLIVQSGYTSARSNGGNVVSTLLILLNVVLLCAALAQIAIVSEYIRPTVKTMSARVSRRWRNSKLDRSSSSSSVAPAICNNNSKAGSLEAAGSSDGTAHGNAAASSMQACNGTERLRRLMGSVCNTLSGSGASSRRPVELPHARRSSFNDMRRESIPDSALTMLEPIS